MENFSVEEDIQAYFSTLSAAEISALKTEIQELKTLVNNQQQLKEKTPVSHAIALGALATAAGAISLAFPPAGMAFGLFVLGAGLIARE